jgi:membrane-bound metal-dependent hydrolase YbcI (DUF457 family)
MQTHSHLLLTALVPKIMPSSRRNFLHQPALLLGAVLPDVPFLVLTAVYGLAYTWQTSLSPGEIMTYLHFDLFYRDPVWLIGHNFFHSLIINGLLLGLGVWGLQTNKRWARPLFWLAIGTTFHTAIDIVTHHSDGPLLFFPLNWTYRFASPVSYWEKAYHGRLFSMLELITDIILAGYFAWHIYSKKQNSTKKQQIAKGSEL